MFITLDGSDGTGKTTVAKEICRCLTRSGFPNVFTAEPTDSDTGRKIRGLLRSGGSDAEMLTDLFIQDRAEHLNHFIIPQLAQGNMVICDRYRYSTVCYQYLQGQPLEVLIRRNANFLRPTLSVILTARDPKLLLERIGNRGEERDFFEKEETLIRVSSLYLQMERFFPQDTFLFLDSGLPIEKLVARILSHVQIALLPKSF